MLENGACVPQRDGVFTPKMNDWMHCLTSFWLRPSTRTNGARYVSNEENACAPAHSFCMMPRKLTIWLHSVLRWLAGVELILPGMPRPCWMSCLRLQPAQ